MMLEVYFQKCLINVKVGKRHEDKIDLSKGMFLIHNLLNQ